MPTLREIKGHMSSVQSIAKVTKALGAVSAAKAHRLMARIKNTSVFAEKSWEVLNHLASAAEPYVQENPIFCGYPSVKRTGLLLITSSRGMVGAYDHSVIALASEHLKGRDLPAKVITFGRVGRNAMLRQGYDIHADFSLLDDAARGADLTPAARVVLDGFHKRLFDEVFVVYTQFKPGSRLQPTVFQLLPIRPELSSQTHEYLYEPSQADLLMALIPRTIRFQIYRAFLEAVTAENTSRVTAMRTATKNAADLMDHLKLNYNKVRQQTVTAELIDILGGSTALSKN